MTGMWEAGGQRGRVTGEAGSDSGLFFIGAGLQWLRITFFLLLNVTWPDIKVPFYGENSVLTIVKCPVQQMKEMP